MNTKRLGNSDLEVTPIGVGAWAMGGGDWPFAWGNQDDAESIAAIHHSLDLGINWIDTAAAYGFGHSEEVVGRAIAKRPDQPYVFTKCSRIPNERGEVVSSLKSDSIRRECEGSLAKLGIDAIDLYQIHWARPEEDIEEGWATLAELQKEGKVRWIGVSNFNVAQMERARAIAPITSLQPPYSLLRREIEAEILPYCANHNIGVLAYSPMASGLLSGKMTRERIGGLPENDWRSRSAEFRDPKLTQNLAIVDRLTAIGARHGKSPAEVAIAWVLSHPAVTAAIVGLRRPDQADGVLGATGLTLSEAELRELEVLN